MALQLDYNTLTTFCGLTAFSLTATPYALHPSVDEDDINYIWYLDGLKVSESSVFDTTIYNPGLYTIQAFINYNIQLDYALISLIPFVNENGDLVRIYMECSALPLQIGNTIQILDTSDYNGIYTISNVVEQGKYYIQLDTPLSGTWIEELGNGIIRCIDTENYYKTVSDTISATLTVKSLFNEYISLTSSSMTGSSGHEKLISLSYLLKTSDTPTIKLYSYNTNSVIVSNIDNVISQPQKYFLYNDEKVDSISVSGINIYFDSTGISSTSYSNGLSSNIFGGLSGYAEFSYYDELSGRPIIVATVETHNNINPYDKYLYLNEKSYANSEKYAEMTLTLTANSPSSLYISKNGYVDLDDNYWIGQKIPFIVFVQDNLGGLLRDYPKSGYSLTSINLVGSSGLSSDDLTFVPYDSDTKKGGYLSGYLIPLSAINSTSISARSNFGINGNSKSFRILDPNDYDYRKINEDYNLGEKMREYALPERLQSWDRLWEIISRVWGDDEYKPYESVGKTIYEKISNFVYNNGCIDTSNVNLLLSHMEMWGIDENFTVFDLPQSLNRLVDFLSINQKTLFGYSDNYGRTFIPFANSQPDLSNLGDKIESSETLSANNYIVIYSSKESSYELQKLPFINTSLSSDKFYISSLTGTNLSAYSFSQYESINPHGLYVDENSKFLSNYQFFHYNSLSGDMIESMIDWTNEKTNLLQSLSSSADWLSNNGIVELMLDYQFKEGLSL